jgi:hypothetical protein
MNERTWLAKTSPNAFMKNRETTIFYGVST